MRKLGVQAIVDDLAATLRRSVVIDDASIQMLYTSAHFGDEDPVRVEAVLNRGAAAKAIGHVLAQGVATWTRAGVIPDNPDLGMHARVCAPIRWRGELVALIMVMDAEGTVTTSELTQITEAAAAIAPLLAEELRVGEGASEESVLHLVGAQATLRRQALADLAPMVGDDFAVVTAIHLRLPDGGAEAASSHVNVAMRSAVSSAAPPSTTGHLAAVSDGSAVLLLGSRRDPTPDTLSAHAARVLARVEDLSSGRFQAMAGIGPSVPGLERAHETAELAVLASKGAALGITGQVGAWRDLGPYGPLLRIPATELGPRCLPAEIQRIAAVDRDGQLLPTLRAFLDAGCSAPAAASALTIHRTTLYYRLGRIEELTGLDLSDGRTRLTLHLGLTLGDLLPKVRQQ